MRPPGGSCHGGGTAHVSSDRLTCVDTCNDAAAAEEQRMSRWPLASWRPFADADLRRHPKLLASNIAARATRRPLSPLSRSTRPCSRCVETFARTMNRGRRRHRRSRRRNSHPPVRRRHRSVALLQQRQPRPSSSSSHTPTSSGRSSPDMSFPSGSDCATRPTVRWRSRGSSGDPGRHLHLLP